MSKQPNFNNISQFGGFQRMAQTQQTNKEPDRMLHWTSSQCTILRTVYRHIFFNM